MYCKLDGLPWAEMPAILGEGDEAGMIGIGYWRVWGNPDKFDPARTGEFDYVKMDNRAHIPPVQKQPMQTTDDFFPGEKDMQTLFIYESMKDYVLCQTFPVQLPDAKFAYRMSYANKVLPFGKAGCIGVSIPLCSLAVDLSLHSGPEVRKL